MGTDGLKACLRLSPVTRIKAGFVTLQLRFLHCDLVKEREALGYGWKKIMFWLKIPSFGDTIPTGNAALSR